MNPQASTSFETSGIGYAKPRPPWAAGCGPDWRIVSNGKRYRVEHRTVFHHDVYDGDGAIHASTEVWDPVWDYDAQDFGVFETRFLWRARRRMRREIREAKAREQKPEWVEVER